MSAFPPGGASCWECTTSLQYGPRERRGLNGKEKEGRECEGREKRCVEARRRAAPQGTKGPDNIGPRRTAAEPSRQVPEVAGPVNEEVRKERG